jgi:UDP-N-acetylmuramate--alanine ligase
MFLMRKKIYFKKNLKKIYFIGIGGIGISALARYYLSKGWQVFGSDLTRSEITDALKRAGARIYIGENPKRINPDFEKIIISPAVPEENPELEKAKKLRIPVFTYPQALGELTKKYFTIAISGTHGKSTTTAMMALLLVEAGLDPTVIMGTKLREFRDSNFRYGKSKYLVIEADEYKDSFLNYWPKIIILTSVDKDHLDYFQNLRNIKHSFIKFINHLPPKGWLVRNADDKNITSLKLRNPKFKIKNFSLRQKEAKLLKKILQIPGEHNVSNALAALTVARILKIPDEISFRTLAEFKGTWRRFDIEKKEIANKKFVFISDYGHHPKEIEVTLKGAREKYPNRQIWLIYQPHQYQRTYYLFNDFVRAFQKAPVDKLILVPIYDVPGREDKGIKKKVSSYKLVRAAKKQKIKDKEIIYLSSLKKAAEYLKKQIRGGEIVIVMGAGDIYNLKKII